jgi:hypothetical protein
MKLIKNFKDNYNEDPIRFWDFDDYDSIEDNTKLYIGGWPDNSIELDSPPKYFFSTEEQLWDADSTDIFIPHCNKIFTICPPNISRREKRIYSFFPISEKILPPILPKIYSVGYAGFAGSSFVDNIIETISKYSDYRYISFANNPCVTDRDVSYQNKLSVIGQTKVMVCHNRTGSYDFQLKSRAFEAAAMNCKIVIVSTNPSEDKLYSWFGSYTDNKNIIICDSSKLIESINILLDTEETSYTSDLYKKYYTTEKWTNNLFRKYAIHSNNNN